jgi:hypothetical protein
MERYRPNQLSRKEAIISFKSGEKPDNLYGEDVWAVVVDEASRTREEAYWALRSTLTATGGPIRIIGNVKGRKNCFYAKSKGGLCSPLVAKHLDSANALSRQGRHIADGVHGTKQVSSPRTH